MDVLVGWLRAALWRQKLEPGNSGVPGDSRPGPFPEPIRPQSAPVPVLHGGDVLLCKVKISQARS